MLYSDVISSMSWFFLKLFAYIFLIFLYCEYLIYYFVLLRCSWPQLSKLEQDFTIPPLLPHAQHKPLRILLIADTHLLGNREGHWFDKLRREWQMYRSYQSSLFIFEPNLVFFLGDLTDEGKWCTDQEWDIYVQRFKTLFSTSSDATKIHVLAGNHDIGFHYSVTDNKLHRFEKSFPESQPYVTMVTYDHLHFILVNSMAFEGDQCRMCARAEKELEEIEKVLDCLKYKQCSEQYKHLDDIRYTKPVLLSHFPLYRLTNENCTDLLTDNQKLKSNYDVLSQDATERLLSKLKPRLAFTAHTHFYCYQEHIQTQTKEFTVPSYSWRNRNDPSFMMLSITANNYAIQQ
ncbi:unnamed protein product, partial [Didymodactylos carnosus]